jgi:hypothetical protein
MRTSLSVIAAGESGSTALRALAPSRARSPPSCSAFMCAASAATSRESHTKPASCSVTSSAAPVRVLVTQQSARERFHRGVRKRVVQGRQNEGVARAVVRPHVGLEPREAHALANVVVVGDALVIAEPAVVADDHEVRRRRQLRQRRDRGRHALPAKARSHEEVERRHRHRSCTSPECARDDATAPAKTSTNPRRCRGRAGARREGRSAPLMSSRTIFDGHRTMRSKGLAKSFRSMWSV